MSTLFNAPVQILFMVIALFAHEEPGRHSYDRPGMRLVFGLVIAELGHEALRRFVSPVHHSHRIGRHSPWMVMA